VNKVGLNFQNFILTIYNPKKFKLINNKYGFPKCDFLESHGSKNGRLNEKFIIFNSVILRFLIYFSKSLFKCDKQKCKY